MPTAHAVATPVARRVSTPSRCAPTNAQAPAGTEVVPLFVYASTVTDAEVLSREIGRLHPSVVVLGVPPLMIPRVVSRYRRFQETGDGPWFKPRYVASPSSRRR